MARIHPSAVVSGEAVLGQNVSIGPLCVVEAGVTMGDNCRLGAHVVIKSGTRLGADNQVCEGAVLGGAPQHLQAGAELGPVLIGDHNVLREYVTIHRGLKPGAATVVGDHNLLMVNAHVAHDCCVGNHTIIANNVMLAGHVLVGDRAYLSGAAGVHQFCRVGRFAMVGGQAHVHQDVPPFVTVDGISTKIVGLNLIGLRRGGFSAEDISRLKAAYRIIYRSGLKWTEVLARLEHEFPEGPASEFHPFLLSSKRGLVHERRTPRAATVKFPAQADAPADVSIKAG